MFEIANFSVINHTMCAFEKHDAVGFVDIESGQTTFHHVIDENVEDRSISGISCISATANEMIYAIGDVSTPPRIILYSYPNTCIGQLQSRWLVFKLRAATENDSKFLWFFFIITDASSSGFYQQIQFWDSDHLIALTFCENYFLEIWNWRTNTQLILQKTNFLFDQQFFV